MHILSVFGVFIYLFNLRLNLDKNISTKIKDENVYIISILVLKHRFKSMVVLQCKDNIDENNYNQYITLYFRDPFIICCWMMK